ncbi:restriction endonuclease subunit S [Casimicrobium huifangae]|uniref:restriction endonuclease subunit S n=1 Tax=Casimicrobium huifangae TaxID=2591109 RepID=UPI0012EBBEAB|nr:restriction endonuclease subunit S [Casimicrobium huifangae]
MSSAWPTKTLSEVCEIKPPKSEARQRLASNDSVSFVPMEDLGIDQKQVVPTQTRLLADVAGSYTYFADGDVLLAKITPCFENGKLGIAANLTNGVGFGSSEYMVLRPSPALDKEWLYYYLSRETFRTEGAARMSGAVGHKRVAKEFIDAYPIPVPPLTEQQRIAGILDEAFDGIATAKANAEKNLQNARALFESHLQAVFTQRGDGWTETTLEGVAHRECTLSYGIVQPGEEVADGLAIVRPTDMTSKVIYLDGLKRIDPKLADSYKRTTLVGGELLLCVRGSTGMLSMAAPELVGGNVTRGIVPIRFDPARMTRDFGFYLMNSAVVQEQIREKTYGTALMQINIRDLRNISFSFPPLKKQEAIAGALHELGEETQRLESLYQQKLAALDELKKSLLHQAFSGAL